ncbi:MAG: hypothetical protein KAF64_04615 [Hydrogenophaga sp.]|uniref:hypothetical protein n=1 Tax=Hydrogenophaga sp. TaxID=1904254 RepID=UPI0025C2ECD3|nr:hypothetical protein [Hydrogenophaga sp.]MBU7572614.1 hypothetical protein [Hydrogenophaga sp.]
MSPPQPQARPPTTAQVLEASLRQDLRDGHWRAAVRRLYMLEHCDRERALKLRHDVEVFAKRLLPREEERLRTNARAWAAQVALG